MKIFTLQGLADELEVSCSYLRNVVARYNKNEIDNFRGYKFFGEHKKVWYAYRASEKLEVVGRH
jgi:hypothetical protein